jgi:hypothetical protein
MQGSSAVSDSRVRTVQVVKTNDEKRIVYGVVYAPYVLDSHAEFMFPQDIENMAHRFLAQKTLDASIDTNHDNEPNKSYPVESFIARKGDPEYPEGAWVLGVKVVDDAMWARVKSNEITAFSFDALVKPIEVEVEVEVVRDHVGSTSDADDGHRHVFFLQVDELGKVVKGWTDEVNGHRHTILKGCLTSSAAGHAHRVHI